MFTEILQFCNNITNSHIFHYIAHSNIVNFILLFGLIIFLWYKLDVGKKYTRTVSRVKHQVVSSDIQKKRSIADLNIEKR